MTIEEAIKNLEKCLEYLEGIGPRATRENVEAVRMSIEALCARQTPAKLDRSRWEGVRILSRSCSKMVLLEVLPGLRQATHRGSLGGAGKEDWRIGGNDETTD